MTQSDADNTLASIFQGVDTFANCARSTAVTGELPAVHDGSQLCNYTICEDIESLQKALNISASVAANFGVASADAKSSYVNTLDITSTSIMLAVYARRVMGTQGSKNSCLKDGIPAPTDLTTLDAFIEQYGDSYVSELTTGAEYIATYVFYCQSTAEHNEIKNVLDAGVVTEEGHITGDVQTAITNAQKKENVRWSVFQKVIGSNMTVPGDKDTNAIVEFAATFGHDTPTAPETISFSTQGYEHATGMISGVWSPVRANRDVFQDGVGTQDSVSTQAAKLTAVANQADSILKVYDTYDYHGDTDLEDRRKTIRNDQNELIKAIKQLQEDPTVPFVQPELVSPSWGYPQVNLVLSEPKPWGGSGGVEFHDSTRGSVLSCQRLTGVALMGGYLVDSMTCTYDGVAKPVKHGGDGGSQSVLPISLGEHEYVTRLWVYTGKGVTYLDVVTNKGQETYGGAAQKNPYAWKVDDGTVVVGFFGKAGTGSGYLGSVGPILCKFNPVTWNPIR